MSLLINGMDMPKNCKDCPCREYGKFSYEPDWCCLNRKNIVNAKTISPNCPLSEIPTPHGRLIDADEIRTTIESMKAIESAMPVHTQQQIFDLIINLISNVATVIEAEE